MANTYLTIDMITNEFLRRLTNNLTFARYVNRQFDDQFGRDGAKIGDTLRIRKPPRYTVSDGPVLVAQDYVDIQSTLTLDKQKHVGLEWTTKDEELEIDEFGARVIEGQAAALANQIDSDGLALYKKIALSVGTPGTKADAMLTYLTAKAKMATYAAPQDNLNYAVIEPFAEATIVDGTALRFNDQGELGRQYTEGKMGRASGLNWAMDQNVNSHTAGTFTTGSTPVVNGAGQTGSNLVTNGWAASTLVLREGDTITLAGVNGVNWMSYDDVGLLREFVVTADVTSDGTGNASIPISPPIITSTAQQTVTASPANGAAITPFGTENTLSKQNMVFHRDAFILGMAPLTMPRGVHAASQAMDEQLNISCRIIRQYDARQDTLISRADVLYGWDVYYEDLACRVQG